MPAYALYFVPHKLEREKLALRRRQLCKRFENRKAVMYPIHLTLVRSFTSLDYAPFMRELERLCARQKPIKLRCEPQLATGSGWGGVKIEKSEKLSSFQRELEELVQKYAALEPASFDPHISLVHAKRLPSLSNRTSPVKKLLLDRVSLCMQTAQKTPFRIAKQVRLASPPAETKNL